MMLYGLLILGTFLWRTEAGFTGPFELSNWLQSPNGGTIGTNNDDGSDVFVRSADDNSGNPATTVLTISQPVDYRILMTYTYTTADARGAAEDSCTINIDGNPFVDTQIDLHTGMLDFTLSANQFLSVIMMTTDSTNGPGTMTLTQFTAMSLAPTSQPTNQPTNLPTSQPSRQPVLRPTSRPTDQPSTQPTGRPSTQPSSRPTGQPSSRPTMQPSSQPTRRPTGQPSQQPSGQPTTAPSRLAYKRKHRLRTAAQDAAANN